MDYQQIIRSQYLATLEMLRGTVEKCPDTMWNDQADKNKFWHVAYHALFYTHLYLQPTEQDFKPWAKQRKANDLSQEAEPYTKEEILEYLAFCQQQVIELVPHLNLEAESGFYWLPMNKAELQIYNIRHLQQHAGELMERLGSHAEIEVDWVGMMHK
jgi:DinB superfamily